MQSRKMLWVGVGLGVVGLAAALTYAIFRLATDETLEDPRSQRIQQLIDEANSLLKALDDQRNSA
ncbi:MAG TPA: hypothetical protein VGX91_09645 [Candidatus Cybelea sp.]|jgi:hypothetical protein|nr:hypothetical protein [Candidatus Cybelea sp.]